MCGDKTEMQHFCFPGKSFYSNFVFFLRLLRSSALSFMNFFALFESRRQVCEAICTNYETHFFSLCFFPLLFVSCNLQSFHLKVLQTILFSNSHSEILSLIYNVALIIVNSMQSMYHFYIDFIYFLSHIIQRHNSFFSK